MEKYDFKKINFIKKILACALYLIACICLFISTVAFVNHISPKAEENNQQELMVKKTRYAVSEDSGTAIPTSGYVENVYFNTNLSVEEVVNIIENANINWVENPTDEAGQNVMYVVFCNETMNKILFINKNPTISLYFLTLADFTTNESTHFFASGSYYVENDIAIDPGWTMENNYVNINSQLIDIIPNFNIEVGLNNNELKRLFSTSPFITPTLTESFLGGVASASGQFLAVLTSAFTAVEGVFLTAEGELSLVGMFLAIGVGAVVITFGIRLLIKLINKIRLNG